MLNAILSLAVIFVFLIVVEVIWRKEKLVNEASRQMVHIGVGTFIAFWPYYMSYLAIGLSSIALFLVILLGRYDRFIGLIRWPRIFPFSFAGKELKFIESLHQIRRRSWGDLIFPASIGLLALFGPAKYIFTIAILCVGLADGLAAVMGFRFGKTKRYKLFDQYKSAAGTITFFVVSLLIVVGVKATNLGGASSMSWLALLYLPLLLTLTENFAVFGTDDFMVPFMALIVLSWY